MRWGQGSFRGALLPHAIGAFWAIVCVAVFASGGPIWDNVGGHAELHGNYVAKYAAAADAVREGHLPLWNPYEFTGVPLFGSVHGAMLYVPVVATHLLLTPFDALQALYALHVALLAWGVTVYLARVGLSPWFGGIATLVALAATVSGLASVGVDHPPFLISLSWIPLQLLFWRYAIRPGGRRWVAALALAVAAPWLAGYPQFLPSTGIILFLVALTDDGRSWSGATAEGAPIPIRRRVGILIAGFALGTALAAVQILPLLEVSSQSFRPNALAQIVRQRDNFRVDSLWRLAYLTPIKVTLGAAVALAAAALVAPDRRRWAWLLALLWSIFALNFPFSLLYRLPPLSMVRSPFELASLGGLFLGLLAAAGAATLFASRMRWVVAIGIAMVVAAVLQAAMIVNAAPTVMHGPAPRYDEIAERMAAVERGRARLSPQARFVGHKEIRAEAALLHEIPSPVGFESSLRPGRIDRLLTELDLDHHTALARRVTRWKGLLRNPDLAAVLGIGFVIAPVPIAGQLRQVGFERIQKVPGKSTRADEVLMFRPPLPRARLVHRVKRTRDEDESFTFVTEFPGRLRTLAVLEGPAPIELSEPPAPGLESVTIVDEEPERLGIEVVAAAPGLLVVTDNYYPGWTATVDGRAVPIERVDYAFRAVPVGVGTHHVVFRYRPASVWWGSVITGVSLLVVLLLLAPFPRDSAAGRADDTN